MSSPKSPQSDGSGDASSGRGRMLVLCFDGTTNEFDGDNTNVVKLFAMLRKDCDDDQLCYYQAGVGTYENPGIFTPLALWVAKIMDEAIAWYLDAHVMGGYQFLMQNYRCGDKISIFGFSRGAYTARALAGMLTKVGLLPRDNVEQVSFAYKMYTRTDKAGLVQAAGFKQTFSRPVEIDFLGVWDTVASTGVIMSRTLPFTTQDASIKTFRHALSLDEHRAKFVPTFYHRAAPSVKADQKDPEHTNPGLVPKPALAAGAEKSKAAATAGSGDLENVKINAKRDSVVPLDPISPTGEAPETHLLATAKGKKKKKKGAAWSIFSKKEKSVSPIRTDSISQPGGPACDVKEVWFAGCHTDVGGGADKNEVTDVLSDVPLRWMVREIIESQCGIQFDLAAMERLNVKPSLDFAAAPPSPPSNGSTQSNSLLSADDISADKHDALQPLHDQLSAQPLWWILEVIPMPFTWQDKLGVWRKKWKFHLGSGRYVNQDEELLFHESVRIRMQDKTLNYTPKAKYAKGSEKYVW